MPIASAASCIAKPRPMQARWPLPNGFQALTGRAASASREKFSGSNTSGFGPHTLGSRCNAITSTAMKVFFFEFVLAADGLIRERRDAVGWRRRPQPQRLLQYLRDVGELGDLLIGR